MKRPVIDYLPFEERIPNTEYSRVLRRITESNEVRNPQFHEGTMRKVFLEKMSFQMNQGFPLITERSISEKALRWAMAEIIGFIHGAVTLTELEEFGLPRFWWERWVEKSHVLLPNGECKFDLPEDQIGEHLGVASYGGVWGRFPKRDGGTLNQWENIIKHMVKYPSALTHKVTNWYPDGVIVPDGKRQVVVAPCHGDVQIELNPEKKDLTLIHLQRSADVPTGVPYNMIHYPGIGMMLAKVLNYTFKQYEHGLVDCHMYSVQEENVAEILTREPRRLPTVTLDFETTGDPVKDFFAIRPEHFHLSDYEPHPYMKVDTVL